MMTSFTTTNRILSFFFCCCCCFITLIRAIVSGRSRLHCKREGVNKEGGGGGGV